MATQMQQGFIWKEIARPPEKQQQSRVFFKVIFDVDTHVVTEKEQERVIENKRDEFCRKKNMKM